MQCCGVRGCARRGESYVGVQAPKLFVCDWKAGKVAAVKGIAADLSAGQPVFTPDGLGCVATSRQLQLL